MPYVDGQCTAGMLQLRELDIVVRSTLDMGPRLPIAQTPRDIALGHTILARAVEFEGRGIRQLAEMHALDSESVADLKARTVALYKANTDQQAYDRAIVCGTLMSRCYSMVPPGVSVASLRAVGVPLIATQDGELTTSVASLVPDRGTVVQRVTTERLLSRVLGAPLDAVAEYSELVIPRRRLEMGFLAALGLMNTQIAGRLGTSVDTTKSNLSSVMKDLGVSRRSDILDELIRRGNVVIRKPAFRKLTAPPSSG